MPYEFSEIANDDGIITHFKACKDSSGIVSMVSFKVVASDINSQIIAIGSSDFCADNTDSGWLPVSGYVLGLYFESETSS